MMQDRLDQMKVSDRDQQHAEEITEAINTLSGTRGIAVAITRDHRTLQQSFMRLALQFIELAAREDYAFDGRNEDTHRVAKIIQETLEANPATCYLRNV